MSTPKLFQFIYSCSSEKVRRALHHKGISWETTEVDWFDRKPVEAVSGQNLVPVFQHEGNTLGPVSIEILDYIEDNFDGPTLYPNGSRGFCHIMNEYDEKVLFGLGCKVFFPAGAKVMNSEAFEADVVRLMGCSSQQLWDDLPKVAEEYKSHFSWLDDMLASNKWLAGDELSAADHIIYSNYWFANNNPMFAEMTAQMGFKNLDGWAARMKEDYFTTLPF